MATKNILTMEVPAIIKTTTENLAQAMTALAKSRPQDFFVSVGHIAQRVIAGQKLQALQTEWELFKSKGKIEKAFEKSLLCQYCLLELLNFLDDPLPDEERFQVLKKIFFVTATAGTPTPENIKPLLYMKLVKTLSSGEVLLLRTCYKISKNPPEAIPHPIRSADEWLGTVVGASTFGSPELVANYEDGLMAKRLLSSRLHGDLSGVRVDQRFRLTQLGYDICEYINREQ